MRHQLHCEVFVHFLNARGIVHVRVLNQIARTARPQQLDQLLAEEVPAVLVLEATQPHGPDQCRIELETLAVAVHQRTQVVLLRIAMGGHAHHFGVSVEHVEAQVVGDGAIHAGQGIRVVEFLHTGDAPLLSVAQKHRGIFALHVDGEDGGFVFESAHVVGAAGMGQLMLHRHELHLVPGNPEFFHEPANLLHIASVTAIAIEQGIEGAVGRVPVAAGVMPARATENGDRRAGHRHRVDVAGLYLRGTNAEARRLPWHVAFGVLASDQTFLFDGRHQFAIDEQRRRGIVAECARKSECYVCHHFPLSFLKMSKFVSLQSWAIMALTAFHC